MSEERVAPTPAQLAARGAVKIVLDRERWLIFDLDAQFLIEATMGVNALGSELFSPLTATNLRLLLYAGLRREDPTLTMDAIGEWLPRHDAERMKDVVATVTRAWFGQRPEATDDHPPEAGEPSRQSTSGSSPAAPVSPSTSSVN